MGVCVSFVVRAGTLPVTHERSLFTSFTSPLFTYIALLPPQIFTTTSLSDCDAIFQFSMSLAIQPARYAAASLASAEQARTPFIASPSCKMIYGRITLLSI